MINPKRGEIWDITLDPTVGREIKKTRPCLVVSGRLAERSGLRIVIPITSWQEKFDRRPEYVAIGQEPANGLDNDSAADLPQLRAVSLERFGTKKRGTVSATLMEDIDAAIVILLCLE